MYLVIILYNRPFFIKTEQKHSISKFANFYDDYYMVFIFNLYGNEYIEIVLVTIIVKIYISNTFMEI